MVKKNTKTSISEVDAQSRIVNEHGKRLAEDQNNDAKKPKRIKNLYRQPTANELNRLQETETLFNSNLFRLQVEEVLQEVKIKEKTEKKFQLWFTSFKNHLLSIEEDNKEYDLTELTLAKKLKVKLPISKKLSKTKCVFKFYKFNGIEIVGSYALECAINTKLRIDLQITVPAATYTKNDSINYRYHKKRAAYLAYIASHLTKLDSIEELQYTWPNGCETKPVLDIKPTGKLANHFTVRLNLVCDSEAYKLHRFSPSRNNLREAWLLEGEPQENPTDVGPPTPYYNNQVLSDLTALENWEFLKETLSKSDNLKQAVVLLKIWLKQRNLQISGHVINLYVAYLVQNKRINNIMSSYQIVRNVWIALKTSDWTKGITLHKRDNGPPLTEFTTRFPVTFLDTTGYYNLCYDMTVGTYNALKRECALAIEMLDDTSINSFIPLFMVPLKPLLQFDYILKFKNLPYLIESIITRAPTSTRLNFGVDQLALVVDTLHKLLSKGLGDRVELTLELVECEYSWGVKKSVDKAREKDGFAEKLSIGIILNTENAFNVIQKGPAANLPEAEEFREFWGAKSELRRFQDGSITETCVWEGDSECELRGVTRQIVEYLLHLKYAVPPTHLYHIYDQLDSVSSRKLHCADGADGADGAEGCAAAVRAFDELRQDLRALTNLPLEISALYGVSPVFSYTEPFPALPHGALHKPWQRGRSALVKDSAPAPAPDGAAGQPSLPPYTPVAKAIIELGHSGKWPGSVQALRCVKAAFHLQLAERLAAQCGLPAQAHPQHVDVLKRGLVFRLEIAHPKEITLLRRETVNGVVRYRETEESVALQCDTALMPRLRGALHGLHQKHPAFGLTACLFKRWLAAHLLSPPHFPAPVAELLAAHAFLRPRPLVAPRLPLAGLLRVLQLLAHTDWRTEMLVLDFNDDITREELSEIESKFSSRESLTPYMYIVTAYDGELRSVWSRAGPARQAVLRAQALATTTLKYFERGMLADMKDNLLPAFVPSLAGYDVLIHLQPTLVPYHSERVDKRPELRELLTELAEDIVPPVEFHPVELYLGELRSAYDEFALFFHDCYGGDVIAVLWRPVVREPRDFQILNAKALKPCQSKGETQYAINIPAILEDFRILGRGIVRDITVCT